jgi:hypothetical protein
MKLDLACFTVGQRPEHKTWERYHVERMKIRKIEK